MRIGFSKDPSLNDVVKFPCPSLLPLSFSIIGRSKAGDRGGVEGELDENKQLIERELGQRVR